MPSKAPTYYHWSQDKPCTTNQIYGFHLKEEMEAKLGEMSSLRTTGPDSYTRPFSNLGFFPEIAASSAMTGTKKNKQHELSKSTAFMPIRRSKPAFNINDGYGLGYYPIYKRVVHRDFPTDVRLKRFQSAPPTFKPSVPSEKDIFLWHTLSGCLVHVKNPSDAAKQQAQIAVASS